MNDSIQIVRIAALALAKHGIENDQAFDSVSPALAAFGEDDLAERLMDATFDIPWPGIAAFLAIASWQVSPAAESRIFRTAEEWLIAAQDIRRVQVALHLDVIPFSGRGRHKEEIELALTNVMERFPETAEQCARLLRSAR